MYVETITIIFSAASLQHRVLSTKNGTEPKQLSQMKENFDIYFDIIENIWFSLPWLHDKNKNLLFWDVW